MIIGGHILLIPEIDCISSDFAHEWSSTPSEIQAVLHSAKFVNQLNLVMEMN